MFSLSRRVLLVAAIASAIFVVGCSEKEEVDPYVYGTLDQVTRGHVQSEGFLFEIDTPEFVFVQGNTGLARVGNHLEVIVADDLENRAPSWSGKLLGVQKFYSPYVWLMAKRVKTVDAEGAFTVTELDSVEAPVIPRFTDVKLDEVSGFDIGTLAWNQKAKIDDMFEAEVQTVGILQYLPDHEAEVAEVAEGEEPAETPMAWYLKAESSDALFKISNVTPALELSFRLLETDGLPFVGGVKIGPTYTFADRRASRVSAPIEIQWMRYANRFLAP